MLHPSWSCSSYRITIMHANNHLAIRNQTMLFFQPRYGIIDINEINSRSLHHDKDLCRGTLTLLIYCFSSEAHSTVSHHRFHGSWKFKLFKRCLLLLAPCIDSVSWQDNMLHLIGQGGVISCVSSKLTGKVNQERRSLILNPSSDPSYLSSPCDLSCLSCLDALCGPLIWISE